MKTKKCDSCGSAYLPSNPRIWSVSRFCGAVCRQSAKYRRGSGRTSALADAATCTAMVARLLASGEAKPCIEDDRYCVTRDGRVFSRAAFKTATAWKPLRHRIQFQGYLTVNFGAGRAPRKVHNLVALAFIGRRPKGLQVRHLDGDPANNHVENLLYGTQRENMADMVAHGRSNRGEKQHMCKLGREMVLGIRELLEDGICQREIAERFNISQTNVSQIKRGATWGWLKGSAP